MKTLMAVIAHRGDTIIAWTTEHISGRKERAIREGEHQLDVHLGAHDLSYTHFEVPPNYERILEAAGVHGGSLSPEELRKMIGARAPA